MTVRDARRCRKRAVDTSRLSATPAWPPGSVPQHHGSIPFAELRRLGISPREIVDFSATVHPYRLPAALASLITADDIAAYPDIECHDAVNAIASFHGVPPHWIALTAGTTETIYALPHLFPSAAVFVPTYADYAAAFARHGVRSTPLPFPRSAEELQDAITAVGRSEAAVLIVCNPNNPDGSYLEISDVELLCRTLPRTVVCVDESYQQQSDHCQSAIPLLEKTPNMLLLRSLTKPFGIGGIRIGYAICAGETLERLRGVLLPWGVSTIGQRLAAGLWANIELFRVEWNAVLAERDRMTAALRTAGFTVTHGRCPFILVNVGAAATVRANLLRTHRLCVRDCTSFGLPQWIRVMPQSPRQNDLLVRLLSLAGLERP